MKTLRNLNPKKLSLLIALSFAGFNVLAQETVLPKTKKFQMGIYAEGQIQMGSNRFYETHSNPVGFASGLAARYRISNTFSIASGVGVSVFYFKFSDNLRYYDQFPIEKISGNATQYALRLPLTLQTNIYKQKLFVSTGVEFTKDLIEHNNITYINIASNNVRHQSYNYNGGRVEAQIMGGLGYNFKALKNNVFSVEANLKIFINNNYKSIAQGDLYSPSLRINWYFIK